MLARAQVADGAARREDVGRVLLGEEFESLSARLRVWGNLPLLYSANTEGVLFL